MPLVPGPFQRRFSGRCDMLTEVYEDWAEADYYLDDAAAANARGDWLAWGYYSYMAAETQQDADGLYQNYLALGCH